MPEAPRRAAPGGLIRTGVLRRLMLAVAVGSLLLAIPPATSAAGSVTLTTPYPAVAVPPGEKVSFKINVETDVPDRVDLSVADVPEGWIASLRGEGFVVDGVQTSGNDPVELTLDVTVPEGAATASGRVVVNARSGAARDSLALDIRVEETAAGQVSLESDFPVIDGAADSTFTFSVRLTNDTAEDLTFSLSATTVAPGWTVEARPSGQAQAASANVTAGGNTTVNVTATPAEGTEAGDYPIVAPGGQPRPDRRSRADGAGHRQLRPQRDHPERRPEHERQRRIDDRPDDRRREHRLGPARERRAFGHGTEWLDGHLRSARHQRPGGC